jgi:DNA-binding NarL/FixJ family response regulator
MAQVQAGHVIIDEEVSDKKGLTAVLCAALSPIESTLIQAALAHCHTLTPREYDVAQRIAAAHTVANIAAELGITIKTVEGHVSSIYNKLGFNVTTLPIRPSVILAKTCLLYELAQ